MSNTLIETYFNWFYEKICSGEKFMVLFQILYLGITEYLEMNKIVIKDDSYVVSEIIGIIYKIACGEKVTYSYFCRILTRLKINLIKNKKISNFNYYNDSILLKNTDLEQ